jgi:hypothetical protein
MFSPVPPDAKASGYSFKKAWFTRLVLTVFEPIHFREPVFLATGRVSGGTQPQRNYPPLQMETEVLPL